MIRAIGEALLALIGWLGDFVSAFIDLIGVDEKVILMAIITIIGTLVGVSVYNGRR